MLKKLARLFGYELVRAKNPILQFHSTHYLRHNARRLEHLASLRIPVAGMKVLEVGAGIGDHSHYYLDRGCDLTITEERPDNIEVLKRRYKGGKIVRLDVESPRVLEEAPFDVVHCYGLLYHLSNPEKALRYLAENCRGRLFLETCVSFGDDKAIHRVAEEAGNPTQASSGTGCRPTRPWVFDTLRGLFEHVYVPRTQPNHEEFPIDWTRPDDHKVGLCRAIFIASRGAIGNELLSPALLDLQARHE